MDLLLDTHTLIWWTWGSGRLGPRAYEQVGAAENRTYISSASVWEICIKTSRGRLQLAELPEDWIPKVLATGFLSLPVTFQHAYVVRTLPHHHGDPFDRMLVAQAQCENLTIVTVDPAISAYAIPVLDAST